MNAQPSTGYTQHHAASTQPIVQKTLLQRFAKQIAFGVLCTIISTVIVNVAGIKKWVQHVCSAVVYVGGNTITGDGGAIKKAEDKLKEIEVKLADKIPKASHLPVPIPAHMPSLHKTPEQMEAEAKLKAEEQKRRDESARKVAIAKLESMGVLFDKEASLEKLQVELKDAEEMHAAPLLDHADKIGLHVDPKEPFDILKTRIKEAELDADYQEQVRVYEKNMEFRQKIMNSYNARCPNQRCDRAFKITAKSGSFRCPKCKVIYTPAEARAHWRVVPFPPEPKRKVDKPGVMDRVKGMFKK